MEQPKIIDRRYRVLSQLGSGLSGEIYQVEGPDGVAALKLLRTEVPGLDATERITTFKFEFSLLKGLSHPNVIRIFDFGFDETLKRFYFTQEWIDGAPIQEAIPSDQLETLQAMLIQALQGLAYLHSYEIIHGDIKPDNLLVSTQAPNPQLKIIDFGISHPRFVQVAGTPSYMAPEKILKEPIDGRSDLYSLAVVFYTLITGKNPFLKEDPSDTLRAHLHFVPPSATSQCPELDPLWSELLERMMKKNPRHRISSAEACLRFLETKGQRAIEIHHPPRLPQHWIGRGEILEDAKAFLDQLTQDPKKHQVLVVAGKAGLGKDHLLTELKYEAELKDMEVLTPEEAPTHSGGVLFLKEQELKNQLEKKRLNALLKKASLLLAIDPKDQKKLTQQLGQTPQKTLALRPLQHQEIEAYLKEVTRNPTIPSPFVNALDRWSGGSPKRLREILTHLLKDPRILDASGKWNLAVFHEVEPTLEQLGLSEESLALAGSRLQDPQERWEVELKRSSALANQDRLDEALKLLNQLEKEISHSFTGPNRLVAKAKLFEKRGWIYIKQNRDAEAREALAAGLSLLSESEIPQPVLRLRLKNFVAFLELRAGKIQEAIQQFEALAQESDTLAELERREVTNNELGSAYLAAEQLEPAIERLQEDLDFFAKLPYPMLSMKTHYNLAEAHCRNGQYSEAFQAYEKVAEIARQERQWAYLLRAYNGLGNTASLQGKRLECLDYYQRSLALAEYLKDYLSAATVAQNRGVILSEVDRLEEALEDLEISKRLLAKVPPTSHSRYLMARATLELGEVFLKKKDFQKAQNYFTEALNRSEEDANLKSFRFYPLSSLAKLALVEKKFENFRELYPQLIHLAQNEEEKKILADLMQQAPEDPRTGMEQQPTYASTSTPTPTATPNFSHEALLPILKINRALIREHDPEKLFEKILEYATELSTAESALLLEVSEDNTLSVRASYNTAVDDAAKEISGQVAQRVLQTGQPIATHDALDDENFNQFRSVVALKLRSIACIPIRIHQKVIGLLYLTHRNRTQLFGPDTLQLLEAFGDQAGLALQNARQVSQLQRLNEELESQLHNAEAYIDQLKTDLRARIKNPYPKILGKSSAIVEILHTLDRISDTNLTVLILGETGSGKELIARSIHDHSRRNKGPFVAVNCGAIPENLIESELFGYVPGAFTGASREKKGLLEEASGGTLFLDEVAELPPNLQVKLLRTLQEKEIRRLGSTQSIAVDLRVLAATHRDLEHWVAEEKFREDLYYRLAQMILTLPALRERLEDLPLLAEHFLKISAQELSLHKTPRISKDLLQLMMSYPWPGNVRELENMIRTSAAFAERGIIHLNDLPTFLKKKLASPTPPSAPSIPTGETQTPTSPNEIPYFQEWTWQDYEEALFAKTYLKHEKNSEKVAEALEVGVATVYVKIRKYNLKNKLSHWESSPLQFPPNLTVAQLKQKVIEKAYAASAKSPYAVAKQLNLNVGTVYRALKNRTA